MRISYKVWLVGGIPIAIAAGIAVVSWMLLQEADRARKGVVLAGTIYRNIQVAMRARDDYVQAQPGERAEHAVHFGALAEQVRADLSVLTGLTRDDLHRAASASARDALARYEQRMRQFMVVTTDNDRLSTEMRARFAALIALTDQARERQRSSNADIVTSLREKDRKQRTIRDIVDRAYEVRAQIAGVALQELQRNYATSWDALSSADSQITMSVAQLRVAAATLSSLLIAENSKADADALRAQVEAYETLVSEPGSPTREQHDQAPLRVQAGQQLADWINRILKVYGTEQRSLYEEVAQLFAYAVQANETEQATQSIAITALKIGQKTADALERRDSNDAAKVLGESQDLVGTVEALPISPLIQGEMVKSIEQWRTRLSTAIRGLRNQNDMIADMDQTAAAMVASARSLNDVFAEEANRISAFVLTVLLFGATSGLLIGGGMAIAVARSITRPVADLQHDMLALARNPLAGPIRLSRRRDELGDMARAANAFVTEIGAREQALRDEKGRADDALAELRRTQANLIQSEKLASLGQLVAGVAHEINTPVGIALTTATTLTEEVNLFEGVARSGQVSRNRFVHFVDRMREGAQLLFSNLTRAAELVQSFKQVAADQVSSERRSFELDRWVHELLTSLRPVLRKGGHTVEVDCPPGLSVDTYPGALAQVITNLVMNALVHGYAPGQAGRLALSIAPVGAGSVRLVFSDDGRGISAEHIGRIYDPFFTTARNRGSTGLGLHIVFNLVTGVLGGRIEVASPPGAGARFTITLPQRVADAPAERQLATA